jgi:hypothetical protein
MSSVHAISSAELPFLSLHLLSHTFSGIFLPHRFDLGNLLLGEHSTAKSWIQKNAVLVLRRWAEWFTGPHGFYIISFFILGLLIYDALRPRPLNGIPTSGRYSWAVGDSGALYRHMMLHKTRTTFFTDQANRVGPLSQVMLGPAGSWFGKLTGLGSHIVVLADGQQLVEVCAKRSREFPDPGLTLDMLVLCFSSPPVLLRGGPQMSKWFFIRVNLCWMRSWENWSICLVALALAIPIMAILYTNETLHHIIVCSLSYKGIIPDGQLALSTGPAFKHHRRAWVTLSMLYLTLSPLSPLRIPLPSHFSSPPGGRFSIYIAWQRSEAFQNPTTIQSAILICHPLHTVLFPRYLS